MNKATEKRLRIECRVACCNAFIAVIARHGRRFFAHEGRVERIERDVRGKFWFHNEYSQQRIYIGDYRREWRGFSHGGTLRQLIEDLVKFVREGCPLWGYEGFGRHWGYDAASLATVVAEGQRLGLIRKPEIDYHAQMQLPAGKTCGDCHHVQRCTGLGYTWLNRTQCDFFPSRFLVQVNHVSTA